MTSLAGARPAAAADVRDRGLERGRGRRRHRGPRLIHLPRLTLGVLLLLDLETPVSVILVLRGGGLVPSRGLVRQRAANAALHGRRLRGRLRLPEHLLLRGSIERRVVRRAGVVRAPTAVIVRPDLGHRRRRQRQRCHEGQHKEDLTRNGVFHRACLAGGVFCRPLPNQGGTHRSSSNSTLQKATKQSIRRGGQRPPKDFPDLRGVTELATQTGVSVVPPRNVLPGCTHAPAHPSWPCLCHRASYTTLVSVWHSRGPRKSGPCAASFPEHNPMKRSFRVAFTTILFLATIPIGAAEKETSNDPRRQAVEKVMSSFESAFNKGDAKAAGRLLDPQRRPRRGPRRTDRGPRADRKTIRRSFFRRQGNEAEAFDRRRSLGGRGHRRRGPDRRGLSAVAGDAGRASIHDGACPSRGRLAHRNCPRHPCLQSLELPVLEGGPVDDRPMDGQSGVARESPLPQQL